MFLSPLLIIPHRVLIYQMNPYKLPSNSSGPGNYLSRKQSKLFHSKIKTFTELNKHETIFE